MKILFSVKTIMMFAWCRKTIDLTNKKTEVSNALRGFRSQYSIKIKTSYTAVHFSVCLVSCMAVQYMGGD